MNLSSGTNVFHDLEIETQGFMDSPESFQSFADQVHSAASSLEDILNSSSNVGTHEDNARADYRANVEHRNNVKNDFGPILDGIYKLAEDRPLAEIYGLIVSVKELAESLENLLHDKAKGLAVSMTDSMQNKKLAQIQHKRLREQWDAVRKFAKLMGYGEFAAIKAKPGNYAASSFKTYAYKLPGNNNEPLYNFIAVSKILGIYYDNITFQEIMEYCLANPDKIEVTEVIL